MNIFLKEIKDSAKSLLIWCLGVFFMIASGMGKYTGISASNESINTIMNKMPKSLQAIMGTGSFDFTKASGFYGMLFLYLSAMAAIHASMIGANIISKEERDKTYEFLFVKPVSRCSIITSKILAALVNIFVFNIITMLSSIVLVNYFGKGENVTNDILKLMLGMFILQLIFMSMSTGISAIIKKPKTSASVSSSILLITFIFSIAIDMNSSLENLKYITPFKYFEAKSLMYGGNFKTIFIILSILIITISFISTYVFYKNKDLNV